MIDKATPSPQNPKAPLDQSGAGGSDSEITDEMIEAGVETYLGFCPDSGVGDALDRKMVGRIYEAMAAVKLGVLSSVLDR
jgi:hypothetical protein